MSELKSFDEMDASHQLAYKMGREEAARRVANGTEIRYCAWHERRAADNSGDEDSGVIVTRFCSSQDGSHECVVETRLLLGITTEDTE